MTVAISQEQPPFDVDEDLRNYLIRMFADIDDTFKKAGKFPERREMPYKPQVGDVHYFGDPGTHNYDAAITTEGFWGLTSSGWTQFDAGAGAVTDHGALTGLGDDDHTQYLLLIGRSGGQTAFGSPVSGENLTLQGSSGASIGLLNLDSPIQLRYDGFSESQQYPLVWAQTAAITGAYIGGCLQVAGTHNVSTGTYIPATFSDTLTINQSANPGFSAHTFINELALIQNVGNFNLTQSLVMNVGTTHARTSSGTSTTPNIVGLSFSPQTRASVSGAVMTKTLQAAVRLSPSFSTVGGSTVNLGTIVGLDCVQPAVGLFQPQAGAENMTAYYGLQFANMTFGGASAAYSVIRSLLNSGTNKWFLDHTGTAESRFGGPVNLPNDFPNGVFRMGASTDFAMGYIGGTNELFMQIANPSTTQWRFSAPSANRLLMQNSTFSGSEINFNYDRFSLGAQSGAVGNQVGAFVAGTRSVSVGGEWSDFLLTQAGNITVNAAMGLVAGWTINAPSITLGTGSVTTGAGLNVGGNPSQGTNRVGLRIISNPSGGGGVNAALWVTAGRSRFDGIVDLNQPIALGGGAAATLGTIGGSGPTAAAQAQWVQIEVNGVNHWIPAWT